MTGRAEVTPLKQRLGGTFQRVKGTASDLELQADFARYLCILVSGFLEKAVAELVLEHARRTRGPTHQRIVELRTGRFANANSQRLQELLGSFDPDWQLSMNAFLADELKDALDSLVNLRNSIAHGESVGVTYHRIFEYYGRVQKRVAQSLVFQRLCGSSFKSDFVLVARQ